MKVLVVKNYKELSQRAATFLLNHVALEPRSVFGLATGSTPEGMYKEIINATKNLSYDFFHCKTFNLDEYVGLNPEHEQSYHAYMNRELFDHIQIQKENIHIPEGHKNNLEKQCEAYERHLERHQVDVQVLGLGANGHIGFNEPGSAFTSRTRVVDLTPATIKANSRFFDTKASVPKKAITMGIATIMQAKKIVIIANGEHKARAVRQMVEGKVSTACPASILQNHPDVTVIVDRAAAKLLKNDYSDHKNGWTDVRILNKNVLPQYKNVLVVSPHPDDSAVSSGATIRALFEQNNVTIMAMTSGYRAAIPGADKKKRIAARKKEALAEAKKLQADLLFPEFHFYDQGRKKWKQDLKKFGKLWKSINPSVVILPHQYDEHPTHRYSTALVEDYIKQEKVKQLELWYYESVWSQHLLTSISQVFCYNEELHDVKNAAINSHTSQVKRIPLVEITENLSRFRALTIPEQKFVTYGQEPINLSSFVEAYHIEKR